LLRVTAQGTVTLDQHREKKFAKRRAHEKLNKIAMSGINAQALHDR